MRFGMGLLLLSYNLNLLTVPPTPVSLPDPISYVQILLLIKLLGKKYGNISLLHVGKWL